MLYSYYFFSQNLSGAAAAYNASAAAAAAAAAATAAAAPGADQAGILNVPPSAYPGYPFMSMASRYHLHHQPPPPHYTPLTNHSYAAASSLRNDDCETASQASAKSSKGTACMQFIVDLLLSH